MTASNDSESSRSGGRLLRLGRMRLLLATVAIVFAGLWAMGAVAAWPALAGFVLIALAALVGAGSGQTIPAALRRDEPSAPRDPLIEAVLTGLPDAVVALDRQGDVVALNAQASAIAPTLRRGEPVSLGLRVPEGPY